MYQEARTLFAQMNPEVTAERVFRHGPQVLPFSPLEIIRYEPHASSPAILHEIDQVLAGRASISVELFERSRNYLGIEFDVQLFQKNPGNPVRVSWENRPGWAIWAPGRLEIILEPNPSLLAAGVLAGWLDRVGPRYQGVLFEPARRRWFGTRGIDLNPLRSIWKERHRLGEGVHFMEENGGPSTLRFFGRGMNGEILFLQKDLEKTVGWVKTVTAPWFWGGIALIATFLLPRVLRRLEEFSLKPRFYALFVYVLLLPLIGIVLLAMGHLSLRERDFWEARTRELRAELLALDNQFDQFRDRLPRVLHDMACLPSFRNHDLPKIRQIGNAWIENDNLVHCEVRDESNQVLYLRQSVSRGTASEILNSLLHEYYLALSCEANRPGKTRRSARINLLEDLFENPHVTSLVSPDKLEGFNFMGAGARVKYLLYRSHFKGDVIWNMDLEMTQNQAIREFLRRYLLRNRPCRVLVKDLRTNRWYGPARRGYGLDVLVWDVERAQREQRALLESGASSRLVLAIKPRFLSGMGLVGMISRDLWVKEVATWKEGMTVLFLLAILIAILSVNLLSIAFLSPLGELARGVGALSRGDSRFRIPISGDDEIGHLGNAFNRMLENLQEKQMAREVQATLQPREFPLPHGFSFAVRMTPSGELGKDFLDWHQLPDGRSSILIGFISGSGIEAAMITALIKASVAHHFSRGGEWEDLFPSVNRFLHSSTDHRRMVGMAAILVGNPVDPLLVAIAGHPRPLLIRQKTRHVFPVCQETRPLGQQPTFECPPTMVMPGEGDLLLFVTEGLAKIAEGGRHSLGYNFIENSLQHLPHLQPGDVVESLEKAWKAFHKDAPPVEDFTILCLTRNLREDER